jgi:hypothetical protein
MENLKLSVIVNCSWKLGEPNVSNIVFLTCNEKMLALLHDLYLRIAFAFFIASESFSDYKN